MSQRTIPEFHPELIEHSHAVVNDRPSKKEF